MLHTYLFVSVQLQTFSTLNLFGPLEFVLLGSYSYVLVKGWKWIQLSSSVSLCRTHAQLHTPPLSSGLIKIFTMTSLFKLPLEISSKMIVFLSFSFALTSFSLCSPTWVLWPSLECNKLCITIRGISGVEFGCCVATPHRHFGGGSSSCLKWESPVLSLYSLCPTPAIRGA